MAGEDERSIAKSWPPADHKPVIKGFCCKPVNAQWEKLEMFTIGSLTWKIKAWSSVISQKGKSLPRVNHGIEIYFIRISH